MTREMPEGFGEGSWVGNSTLHPLGLVLLIVCVISLFASKRQNAFMPFFALACVVSPAQRIVVAGIDLNFFRLSLLALCVRLILRSEHRFFKLHKFDVVFFAYVTSFAIIYMISSGKFGDPLGQAADLLMLYIAARCLIRKTEEVERVFKFLALLSIPVAVMFFIESMTGRNLFSVFGGVPEFTKIREGRLRCQGPFPHPIIAGCFWAILFPVFVGLYVKSKQKLYIAASIFSILIIVTTASSTPIMAVAAAPIFLLMFKIRQHVKKIFYLGLLGLLLLHMVMEQPVWHLLARVGAVGGSTSYFRYQLVDAFIGHANEWFLLGTGYVGHWFYGAQDITNHFVLMGVKGGALTLILFIAIIWMFYKNIYRATQVGANKVFIWSIGAAMSVSCVSFIGVAHFGQSVYLLFILFPIALNILLYERYRSRE